MSSKWSPRDQKERPRTPRNPLKNREGKRHKKGAPNKPVLASEREARLRGELCTDMVPDVEQPGAPRAITETQQRRPEPPRGTQSYPKSPRAIQSYPKPIKATQKHPEAPRGTQKHSKPPRATQRNPEPQT